MQKIKQIRWAWILIQWAGRHWRDPWKIYSLCWFTHFLFKSNQWHAHSALAHYSSHHKKKQDVWIVSDSRMGQFQKASPTRAPSRTIDNSSSWKRSSYWAPNNTIFPIIKDLNSRICAAKKQALPFSHFLFEQFAYNVVLNTFWMTST